MSHLSSSRQSAAYTLLVIFALTIVFHLLVITGIIDATIVWGGKFQTTSEIIGFEIVSIVLNTLFLLVILRKTGRLRMIRNEKVINGILWGMAALFLLNTLGNLLSENRIETLIFTPITLLLTLCCTLLARNTTT
jgi:hypothetical protein